MLISTLAGVQFVEEAKGDPYYPMYLGDVAPDNNTIPSKIWISSPENNAALESSILFSFNVSSAESATASYIGMERIYYQADWQQNNTVLLDYNTTGFGSIIYSGYLKKYFTYSENLTGIPEGNHSILVFVDSNGNYTQRTEQPVFTMASGLISSISWGLPATGTGFIILI